MAERQRGHDADAGHAHKSPCCFVCLCFLAHAPVESGLLLFDLLVHSEQTIDDRPQHVLIEQSAHMVAELTADRTGNNRPISFSKLRIWFSRSRRMLTRRDRATSSDRTAWLSSLLTRTSRYQPTL